LVQLQRGLLAFKVGLPLAQRIFLWRAAVGGVAEHITVAAVVLVDI
jgi:hypothetical protein